MIVVVSLADALERAFADLGAAVDALRRAVDGIGALFEVRRDDWRSEIDALLERLAEYDAREADRKVRERRTLRWPRVVALAPHGAPVRRVAYAASLRAWR